MYPQPCAPSEHPHLSIHPDFHAQSSIKLSQPRWNSLLQQRKVDHQICRTHFEDACRVQEWTVLGKSSTAHMSLCLGWGNPARAEVLADTLDQLTWPKTCEAARIKQHTPRHARWHRPSRGPPQQVCPLNLRRSSPLSQGYQGTAIMTAIAIPTAMKQATPKHAGDTHWHRCDSGLYAPAGAVDASSGSSTSGGLAGGCGSGRRLRSSAMSTTKVSMRCCCIWEKASWDVVGVAAAACKVTCACASPSG